MIDNGTRKLLVIEGVFDGMAGVQGNRVAFVPNLARARAHAVKEGVLDGQRVSLSTTKDPVGPFWTSRFEVIE